VAGSEAPSAASSPSPVADVVQAARVKHVAVGDLSVMRFAGAGHGLMYRDPQGLAQAVLLFFAVTATTAEDGD
jgi:hypothetical protein